MKTVVLKILAFLIPLLVILLAIGIVWTLVVLPRLGTRDAGENSSIAAIVSENENIDMNPENGRIYVNNEIILVAAEDAGEEDIRDLVSEWDAELDTVMGDIGIYRVVFDKDLPYDKLQSRIKKLKNSEYVEDAYLDLVTFPEEDDEEEEFETRDPIIPDDKWNKASWNTAVPRNENWGMEAVDAPGAWGYRDLLSEVRVGLIDSYPNTGHEDLRDEFDAADLIFVDTSDDMIRITYNDHSLSAQDHGTHVSGIMAASWDNGTGVSGMMAGKGRLYYSAVYYVENGKVSERYGTAFSYLLALKHLIDQDVQVINISQNTSRLIGFAASRGNKNAVTYLKEQASLAEKSLLRIIHQRQAENKPDFVICVAAGNNNSIEYYRDDSTAYGYRDKATFGELLREAFYLKVEKDSGNALAVYNNFLNLMTEQEVRDRVIVVGAAAIHSRASTSSHTAYSYAYYSNVGDRVDIVAPGSSIYSCKAKGYDEMSGTSMATPHVSGAAGLVFAANPELTGPEVKLILLNSTTQRFYYHEGSAGMLNVHIAVVKALKPRDKSVKRLLMQKGSGLDLCLVVDTTGSMGDDINDAKMKMQQILNSLAEKTDDYRIALIDYRDYAERSGRSYDYPAKLRMDFTDDDETIRSAINALDLGHGGDENETVFSGLMMAAGLNWREGAQKVIIVMGDAPPLDPEPGTGYTYADVVASLYNAKIMIDYSHTDTRVLGEPEDSLIQVYSIGTDASGDAEDFFRDLSGDTGGSFTGVDSADEVGQAIVDSIEQIEIAEPVVIKVKFGEEMADQTIELYEGKDYLFSFRTDDKGSAKLIDLPEERYSWKAPELYVSGSVKADAEKSSVTAKTGEDPGYSAMNAYWTENASALTLWSIVVILLLLVVPPLLLWLAVSILRRKQG